MARNIISDCFAIVDALAITTNITVPKGSIAGRATIATAKMADATPTIINKRFHKTCNVSSQDI